MKLLLFEILIFIVFFSCSSKNSNTKKNTNPTKSTKVKMTQNVSLKNNVPSVDNSLTSQDSSIVKKVEDLAELSFIKDTVFFPKNELYFVDMKQKKGFLRTYYCGKKPLTNVQIKENKIISGLFIDAAVVNNVVEKGFELVTYVNGEKEGTYAYIEYLPTEFGHYKKGKKSGEWMTYYLGGRWSGTVYKEIFKNDKQISKSSGYSDWNAEATRFLNKKESKAIREFIYCLFGNDFYKDD